MNVKELLLLAGLGGFVAYLFYQRAKSTYTPGAAASAPAAGVSAGAASAPAGSIQLAPVLSIASGVMPSTMPVAPFAVGTPLDPAMIDSGGLLTSNPYTIWN